MFIMRDILTVAPSETSPPLVNNLARLPYHYHLIIILVPMEFSLNSLHLLFHSTLLNFLVCVNRNWAVLYIYIFKKHEFIMDVSGLFNATGY